MVRVIYKNYSFFFEGGNMGSIDKIKSMYKYWYHEELSSLYLGTTLSEARELLGLFNNMLLSSETFNNKLKYQAKVYALEDFINENDKEAF